MFLHASPRGFPTLSFSVSLAISVSLPLFTWPASTHPPHPSPPHIAMETDVMSAPVCQTINSISSLFVIAAALKIIKVRITFADHLPPLKSNVFSRTGRSINSQTERDASFGRFDQRGGRQAWVTCCFFSIWWWGKRRMICNKHRWSSVIRFDSAGQKVGGDAKQAAGSLNVITHRHCAAAQPNTPRESDLEMTPSQYLLDLRTPIDPSLTLAALYLNSTNIHSHTDI